MENHIQPIGGRNIARGIYEQKQQFCNHKNGYKNHIDRYESFQRFLHCRKNGNGSLHLFQLQN